MLAFDGFVESRDAARDAAAEADNLLALDNDVMLVPGKSITVHVRHETVVATRSAS